MDLVVACSLAFLVYSTWSVLPQREFTPSSGNAPCSLWVPCWVFKGDATPYYRGLGLSPHPGLYSIPLVSLPVLMPESHHSDYYSL